LITIRKRYFNNFTSKLLIASCLLFFFGCASVPKEYSTAEKLYKKGQYIEAYEHYNAALSKVSTAQERLKIENTLKNLQETIVQDSLAKAQQLHDTQSPSLSSLTEAIGILNRALPYDDSRGLIQAALTAYKADRGTLQDKKAQLVNRAEELYLDGRLPEVIPVYEEIIRLEPQNKQMKSKLDDIKREIEVRKERYRKNIDEYLQSGNVDIAKYFMDKLTNLAPNYPEAGQLRKRIDESWDQGILKSSQEEREKRLLAYKTYKERQEEAQSQQQEGQQGMNFVYSRVKERGGKYYYEKSIRRFVAKDIYAAYGAALKARMLEPDDTGIRMVYEKCEASLDKAVQIKIMVTPFQGLSSYGGRALSETLSNYLYSRLPYGVTMLDSGAKKTTTSEPDILISGHAQSRSDSPSLTVRITDRQGSFMDYTDSVDLNTANNIETLASQIGEIILKYLGQQEKKYYQLAHLYLERNQTEKALKPLALGAFFCQRTNKSNEYCSNLQNLLISASE